MKPWSCSAYFAAWLKMQKDTEITSDLVNMIDVDSKGLSMGDLICVLYYGNDSQALKALKRLREAYVEELFYLSENQGIEHETSWN